MTKKAPLVMEVSSKLGQGDVNVAIGDRLVSHFDAALKDDIRTGEWSYVVCKLPVHDNIVVVGTVVHTIGDRLLFFPMYDIVATMDDGVSDLVHHVTLDPESGFSRRSHIAHIRDLNDNKGARGVDFEVGRDHNGLDYWFTLSIPLNSDHIELPGKLSLAFSAPSAGISDMLSRIDGRLDTHLIRTPSFNMDHGVPEALQLDFWTGPSDPKDIKTQAMGFRVHEEDPIDKSTREAGHLNFDHAGPPWIKIVSTWRDQQLHGVNILRSNLNDGAAELLT